MKILTNCADVLSGLCIARKEWGMFISFNEAPLEELQKAAPYLSMTDVTDIFVHGDGEAFLFFGSEKECGHAYWSTVGDDGPTETNSYNGPARVFACTCGPDGVLRHENT